MEEFAVNFHINAPECETLDVYFEHYTVISTDALVTLARLISIKDGTIEPSSQLQANLGSFPLNEQLCYVRFLFHNQ